MCNRGAFVYPNISLYSCMFSFFMGISLYCGYSGAIVDTAVLPGEEACEVKGRSWGELHQRVYPVLKGYFREEADTYQEHKGGEGAVEVEDRFVASIPQGKCGVS